MTELERLLSQDNYCLVSVASIKKALEQKLCDDAVSRADAIKKVSEILKNVFVEYEDIAQKAMGSLPSVQPKPKVGHWIYELEDWNKWTCSECGWHKRTDIHVKLGYKYCPNCGCQMVKPQESEE